MVRCLPPAQPIAMRRGPAATTSSAGSSAAQQHDVDGGVVVSGGVGGQQPSRLCGAHHQLAGGQVGAAVLQTLYTPCRSSRAHALLLVERQRGLHVAQPGVEVGRRRHHLAADQLDRLIHGVVQHRSPTAEAGAAGAVEKYQARALTVDVIGKYFSHSWTV